MDELITLDVASDSLVGMRVRPYKDHPQRGVCIGIDEADGRGSMFEVVMVAHSGAGLSLDNLTGKYLLR